MVFAERLDRDGECRAEKTDLVVIVAETDNLFEDGLEFRRQKLVCLVHDNGFAVAEIRDLFGCQVENSAWCSYDDVDRVVKAHNVVLEGCAPGGDHALNSHVFADLLDDGGCLESKFTSRDQDKNCGQTQNGFEWRESVSDFRCDKNCDQPSCAADYRQHRTVSLYTKT